MRWTFELKTTDSRLSPGFPRYLTSPFSFLYGKRDAGSGRKLALFELIKMFLGTIILSWCYFTPNLFYRKEITDDVEMEVITKISSATCLRFGKFSSQVI